MNKTILTKRGILRVAVLESLIRNNGSGKTKDILSYIYKEKLLPESFLKDSNLRNELCWARKDLILSGKISSTSSRGIWELAEDFGYEFYILANSNSKA